MEQLLDDYYNDLAYITDQMIAWCEPTRQALAKIKRNKRKIKRYMRGKNEKLKNFKNR